VRRPRGEPYGAAMRKLVFVLLLAACGSKPAPFAPASTKAVASGPLGAARIGVSVDGGPLTSGRVILGEQIQHLDAEGNARFELPAGEYVGTISGNGIYESRFTITVVAGKEVVQNMRVSSVNELY